MKSEQHPEYYGKVSGWDGGMQNGLHPDLEAGKVVC